MSWLLRTNVYTFFLLAQLGLIALSVDTGFGAGVSFALLLFPTWIMHALYFASWVVRVSRHRTRLNTKVPPPENDEEEMGGAASLFGEPHALDPFLVTTVPGTRDYAVLLGTQLLMFLSILATIIGVTVYVDYIPAYSLFATMAPGLAMLALQTMIGISLEFGFAGGR